jgi:SAM-dependent methyltransferase
MARWTERDYLLTEQYRDAAKLRARMGLHERFSVNRYGWHRWVFDQLDLPPHDRVLELGGGPAMLWRENGERIPAGWTVVLADLSPGMLQEARRQLRALPLRFALVNLDAQALPFAPASVDAVIANHMLYHVPDRQQVYAEIRRVLRPGGHLYAATNGRDSMRELAELVRRVPGLRPVDCGRLEMARMIESLTPLLISVNVRHKSHAGVKLTGLPEVTW